MKVILRNNVEKLGNAGELVDVKPGYARNYLIPNGFALLATESNRAVFENEKKQLATRMAKDKESAEALAQKLEAASVTIPATVGDNDQMFGSVTSQDIADNLKSQGIEIDKRKIILEEPIKALGLYTVDVKLHTEVIGKVKVWVVKK